MTIEQIKEELSNCFVGLVATYRGYKLTKPSDTGGVDYTIGKDVTYVRNGKTRYIQNGLYIDLQLKATTESSVIIDDDVIKYDLEAKTFNDLIVRREFANAPLYLILFILPKEHDDWVELNDENILLRKYAYWYIPPNELSETDNVGRIRISIPMENKLNFSTFDNWFNNNYN